MRGSRISQVNQTLKRNALSSQRAARNATSKLEINYVHCNLSSSSFPPGMYAKKNRPPFRARLRRIYFLRPPNRAFDSSQRRDIERSMRDSLVRNSRRVIHPGYPSIHPHAISRYSFVVHSRRIRVSLVCIVSVLNRGRSRLSIKKSARQVGLFPVSRGNMVPRADVYTQGHPGSLSTLTSALSLFIPRAFALCKFEGRSLFLFSFCSRGASRRVACDRARARGTGPPHARLRTPRRGDRDAKETRAAFKLAAAKRINSPGSLDLLIRAAVAFLRGPDR